MLLHGSADRPNEIETAIHSHSLHCIVAHSHYFTYIVDRTIYIEYYSFSQWHPCCTNLPAIQSIQLCTHAQYNRIKTNSLDFFLSFPNSRTTKINNTQIHNRRINCSPEHQPDHNSMDFPSHQDSTLLQRTTSLLNITNFIYNNNNETKNSEDDKYSQSKKKKYKKNK